MGRGILPGGKVARGYRKKQTRQTAFGIRKVLKTGEHHPGPKTEGLSTRSRHVLEKVPNRSVARGFQEGENEEPLGDSVPILEPTEI